MSGDVVYCYPRTPRSSVKRNEELSTVLAFVDDVLTQLGEPDLLDRHVGLDGDEDIEASEPGVPSSSEEDVDKSTRRPQRTDKRQREELRDLRVESEMLESQLEQLRKRFRKTDDRLSPTNKRSTANDCGDLSLTNLRAHTWQIITQVQQKRREASEQEHMRLLQQIKEQKLVFRSFRRFLARHISKTVHTVHTLQHLADEHGSALDQRPTISAVV